MRFAASAGRWRRHERADSFPKRRSGCEPELQGPDRLPEALQAFKETSAAPDRKTLPERRPQRVAAIRSFVGYEIGGRQRGMAHLSLLRIDSPTEAGVYPSRQMSAVIDEANPSFRASDEARLPRWRDW
jgi:hypothetical protein